MFFGMNFLSQLGNNELGHRFKTEAQMENQALFMELFNRWSNLAVTRFDWENLPSGVDERVLNMGLYFQGTCAFYKHEVVGLTALPCTPGNTFNFLYQPTSVTVYGYGMSKVLNDPNKFGFVRVSPSSVPLAATVYEYTKRMADTLRALDVCLQRMKRPYVIACDEKQRMTFMNLFKNIKDNEELILGLKNFPLEAQTFEVAPLPYSGNIDQLWQTYRNYERILYTAMGVQTVPGDKKERLLVDEVNSNNMVIELANEVNLKELQLCIDATNEKFGTHIAVSLKELKNFDEDDGFRYQEEGTPNGEVHD